ncbi:MAG: DUF1893 domain-containing protein [Oscillospiraceae bacterium]
MNDLDIAKDMLCNNDATCVVVTLDEAFASKERGIKPIVSMLNTADDILIGACVADKVIGKAAALLFAYGKISAIYAEVISEPAIVVFEEFNIKYSYGKCVKRIQNRTKDGLCPMETRAMEISNPADAYKIFKELIV